MQVALLNFVKKKHLIKELSQFGITSSYDECLLFKGSAAYATMERGYQKVRSARKNHMLIQGVADNFPNELKQSLSMAGIMNSKNRFQMLCLIQVLILYVVNQSKIFNLVNFQRRQFTVAKVQLKKKKKKVTQNFRSCLLTLKS